MQKWNFYTSRELKPQGWLKRQLQLQAQGLNGNLDKVWPDVRDSAWIGGDREGWERVPYWLDGFIPLAYLLENRDMIARAQKYIDAILSFQKPNGWICPCTEDQIPTYDSWAVLLISKVLKVYYDCSGDERIPDVLYRVMKNYYELLKNGTIHLFDWGQYRWYEGFIALNFLRERYSDPWISDLARLLREQGIDYETVEKTWEKPLNQWTYYTHEVNLVMMLKSEALSCGILGEPYTDRAEKFWKMLNTYHGTAAGIFTGDECLSGLSPIQGTELCGVVEQMYSCEWLYAFSGDRKWAERLEVAAFNALPAAISDDMWTHQYDQLSNQIACQEFPGKPLFRTNGPDAHIFGLEPHFGCCTANFGQGWPKLALSAFLHSEKEVISALPIPSELTTPDQHILLSTDYPFENRMVYEVEANKDFTLRIRIPSFAENLVVNGTACRENELAVPIAAGEKKTIRVEFETSPRLEKRPHELNTVKCGSLVFSLPVSAQWRKHEYTKDGVQRTFPYCDYELLPKSPWSYGYSSTEFEVKRRDVPDVPFSSEKPAVTVSAELVPIDWGYEDGYETVCAKIPESREPVGAPERKELHPYGCAKLRMTELPLICKK